MSKISSSPIPLLNLQQQHREIRDEIMEAVTRVIDAQQFILGPAVERFEQELAAYCGTKHAVGCASGSDALLLALRAANIGAGDEVITTPFTFFATAGAILHAGATPVFADIEADTFNLSPPALAAVFAKHPQAKAVMPVHLFGAVADMDAIHAVASRYGAVVIEDAAQAVGAEYKGVRAGGLGLAGCLSFFPTKNLGAFGDGGAVTCNDDDLDARLRKLRVHGSRVRYVYDEVGYNSRLDALQAAVLSVKLKHLDRWTEARQRNAALYRELLQNTDLPVRCQEVKPYQTRHVYHHFVLRCPQRDELRSFLTEQGIGNEVYYPIPLHLQQAFANLGYHEGDFPESELLAQDVVALPVHPELEEGAIPAVVDAIQRFYRRGPNA